MAGSSTRPATKTATKAAFVGATVAVFAALALVVLAPAARAEPSFSAAPPLKQTQENLPKLDSNNIFDLSYYAGPGQDAAVQLLRQRYPGYSLVGQCAASFRKAGNRDFGLALVNSEAGRFAYAALSKLDGNRYELTELAQGELSFNSKGKMQRADLEVSCMSWTELRRTQQDYIPTDKDDTRMADLHLLSQLDALCIGQDLSEAPYACHAYDLKRKKFVRIGGWYNG